MAHALQVLGFGAISIDELVYVNQPLNTGKGKVTNRVLSHGGNVATALVAVSALGGRAGFIGWLSDQPEQMASASELEKHGVDISFAPRSPKASPVHSIITVGSDGDRFIAYDDEILHGTSENFSSEVLAQASVLLIDGYAVNALPIVAKARDLGLNIVADIEWSVGSQTEALIQMSDHLVLPWGFAKKITGQATASTIINDLWAEHRACVVLTKGDEGAYVRQSGDPVNWHIPAHKVDVTDTTGAGDCFHGAFAFALARGEPPLSCARYATAAAAISTTGHGGRGALPDHAACLSLMASEDAPVPKPFS